MRDWYLILLIHCPLTVAFPVVDLLLPGFGDHTLQAGVLNEVRFSGKYDQAVNFSRRMI
jgi:hypothetical protein